MYICNYCTDDRKIVKKSMHFKFVKFFLNNIDFHLFLREFFVIESCFIMLHDDIAMEPFRYYSNSEISIGYTG